MVDIKSIIEGIYAGYSFRNKIVHKEDGDLSVIQMKNVDYKNYSIDPRITLVDSAKLKSKVSLLRHDILFVAKGSNNCAIEYVLDFPQAIASSAFFIIRPDRDKVVPTYLAWYINQPPVQRYLKENIVGTYTPSINKSVIESIMISLPEKSTQEKIAMIDRLRKKELLLKELISEKRDAVIDALLLNRAGK